MDVRSLGFRTDLIFHRFEGEVEDRGDHLAIRTPSNPTFRWGNLLYFAAPPTPGDRERWEALFVREIGDAEHRVFAWDPPPDAAPSRQRDALVPFEAAGYRPEWTEVLVAGAAGLRPPPHGPSEGLEVRPLADDEWGAALDLQVLCNEIEGSEGEGFRPYRERKMAAYRRMRDAGLGDWYGGFLDGRLVADMGLFHEGGLARFQAVETHPDHRRRGVAGTMVHALARRALDRRGVRDVVIHADPDGPALALYRSLGFAPRETLVGVDKHPA